MTPEFSEWLEHGLKENALHLSNAHKDKLLQFLTLISDWNRVFNLTTILKPRDMVYLHIIDSLILTPYLQGSRLLDVGSGAGLPGIPLAIINPLQQWVLLDKSSKKTRFLTQVVAALALSNVTIIHDRCENFHPDQCFDTILSRALGTIRFFVEKTEHLICPHGYFIAMKGKYPKEELNDIPKRFIVTDVIRLELEGTQTTRHIVKLIKR